MSICNNLFALCVLNAFLFVLNLCNLRNLWIVLGVPGVLAVSR